MQIPDIAREDCACYTVDQIDNHKTLAERLHKM